jgi:hypothetical protein
MTAPAPTSRSRRLVRLAGLVAVAGFLALVIRFWHPVYGFTVFYQLDAPNDDLKITAFRELPVYVHRDTGGYDGLYYAQIAHDPTLRDPELPRAMDNFAYRARRILPPALAWLLGAGRPAWIIHTYALLNLAVWLALAGILWRLLAVRDARTWLAWAGVLFSAGALSSVRLALTDLTALTMIAGAVLAAERARPRLAAAALAFAGLARETSLLVAAGLVEAPWFSRRNLWRLFVVAVPLALWLGYVRWRVGPADAGWANFTWPGAGLVEKWQANFAALATVADRPLAWTTGLATLALTVQAAFFFIRPRFGDRWWRIGTAHFVMLLFLGTAVWEGYPGAATRVLLPLNLAFNVVVCRSRAALAWLILGNLTVFAGLLALRDVPQDPSELVAQRLGSGTAIVRFGPDWFGREQDRKHVWLWTASRGTLRLEARPAARTALRLEFALRSLTPRTVILKQDGREVWRGDTTASLTRHSVNLPASAAVDSMLEFSSSAPAVPESPAAGARELSFALYDLRLALPER